MELDEQTTMRYCRHILLPLVGEEGQEKLMNSHALVVGAGGLGCAALPYLVASGVGKITVFDGDTIDSSNLQRQILYTESDISSDKVTTALASLKRLNRNTRLYGINQPFEESHRVILNDVDVVLDCSDNLKTRLLLNRLCWHYRIPLISGSAIRMEGQLLHFAMNDDEPCYACMAENLAGRSLSCMESGVLSPVVGTIGTLQATEALKRLVGIAKQKPKLLLYDGLQLSFNTFDLNKSASCEVCRFR